MKKLLLITFLSLSYLQINAQCAETLMGFGNNPDQDSYNVVGDVTLILNTNNTITLNLGSNFRTAPGPDVRAFLVDSNGISDDVLATTLIANLNHFEIGLTQASGRQSFTVAIPNGKNIADFDKVFFYCLDFDHFWDLGTFTSFSSNNCSVLNIDEVKIDKISFYPNPAKNKIQLSNIDAVSVEIRIFNVLGKQVFHQSKITNNSIDISSFNKGIYLAKINVDGKTKTQKLVIQ
ncbi:T9SS type A sorting domain-containing protein [Polaribacter vadi]|uniref:T9SS type A sorting domain-containing protein n=1 Tax=Polaribacter TaxID=52959 RepID=UPI001C09C385|nr:MULTISPECIES: T9SS type A sorting domain-containing protein [Polaribacter]MBU3010657.1 T9SS type A sorting domain-containing protein [Polaribacter vadi]MDO6740468.1 T9SS type A sorting domain-containing protein [Polaribacter sp. 1_MG-2023]